MKQNMYIQSYNIKTGCKNYSMIKRPFSAPCGPWQGVRYTQATALIYNKLNTGMRLVEPCPLIEGCFYRPVFDTKEGNPKVKFYTEGLEIMLGKSPA